MLTEEFDVATFLDHLVYDWLKRLYFPELLFTTQEASSLRQAVATGMALPVTAMYRTSPPFIEDQSYGRSVMKRTAVYNGEVVYVQLMDYTVKYAFFAASYLLTPVTQAFQKVLTLDKERYFDFDLSFILPPTGSTRVEFRKAAQDFKPEPMEGAGQRKFYISAEWELRITLPCIESPYFLEQINLFINDHPVATIGG